MKTDKQQKALRRKYITLLIVIGLLIYISSQNTQKVTVNFLFWSTSLSLILLIYITFITGVISGLLFKSINQYAADRVVKKNQKNSPAADDQQQLENKKSLFKKITGKKGQKDGSL